MAARSPLLNSVLYAPLSIFSALIFRRPVRVALGLLFRAARSRMGEQRTPTGSHSRPPYARMRTGVRAEHAWPIRLVVSKLSVGSVSVLGMSITSVPHADRPVMPEGYGLPSSTDGMLKWSEVEARLVTATHYWLATVRPDGRPHVVPRWGVWVDGRFWYDGAPTTVHARNLVVNQSCSLNLENGTEAVIVEGESLPARAPAEGLGARLSEAFAKYHDLGYQPKADAWAGESGGGLRVLTPRRALAWFAFPADATRFQFDG